MKISVVANTQSNMVERHPLAPFVDEGTQVLFLGSFPPPRSKWAKGFEFFYPNFINDHWRIMGLIFYDDKDHFVDTEAKTYKAEDIIRFAKEHGIGYYDTSEAVKRLKNNASDKFLEVVEPTDIRALISKAPQLRTIIVTGQKAADTLCAYFHIEQQPKMGESIDIPYIYNSLGKPVELCRLPSSSRAYPMRLEQKAEYYRAMIDR